MAKLRYQGVLGRDAAGRLDVVYGTGPTLEAFRVLSLFRFEAPLIGTWTTTRQDDTAKAYRLTTQRGRLDGAGEYGRRWAAPRRWRAGRAAVRSPHTSARSAHISVSVRRTTLESAGSGRSLGGIESKARLLQAPQAKNQAPPLRLDRPQPPRTSAWPHRYDSVRLRWNFTTNLTSLHYFLYRKLLPLFVLPKKQRTAGSSRWQARRAAPKAAAGGRGSCPALLLC